MTDKKRIEILIKENKNLKKRNEILYMENQKLRTELGKTSHIEKMKKMVEDYRIIIEELNQYDDLYKSSLNKVRLLSKDYQKELKKLSKI